MLRHRLIDRICCIVLAATLLLTCGLMSAVSLGFVEQNSSIGYETRLFDQEKVHTIDIVMDDWESFLQTCMDEQYAACDVVIDGEHYGNVGIRAKGNTSLSSVMQHGNDRYSFKIEFDHYQTGKTYHGLDKLSLNNLIQDKTYLKDYLAYTLMNRMQVAAPLCSFVQINVNGEPWGLYLAVEAVEDSFLLRNYGADHGELYKPDSLSFGGGGPGRGKDFDMDEFREQFSSAEEETAAVPYSLDPSSMFGDRFSPPDMGGFTPGTMPDAGNEKPGSVPDMSGFTPDSMPDMTSIQSPEGFEPGGGGFGGGRGDSDVRLQYTDDDPASYENIFSSAKTDMTEEDQKRLIASLKKLSEGMEIDSAVDVEAVIRYLVVHNFMCNDDSYTGMMVHNYYLYEEDGRLSMLPWDYNLALGGFSMGGFGGDSGATSTVNSPIDSPVSMGDVESRPMVAWIFQNEEYTALYHQIYDEFIAGVFESGWFETEAERVGTMIAPYVEKDTNGFFSYEEFQTGLSALKEFCALRAKSIRGQLEGSIPSTAADQQADSSALIDASHLELSDMGEFGMGRGGMPNMPNMPDASRMPNLSDMANVPSMPTTPDDAGSPNGFPPQMTFQGTNPFAQESFPDIPQGAAAAGDENQPVEPSNTALSETTSVQNAEPQNAKHREGNRAEKTGNFPFLNTAEATESLSMTEMLLWLAVSAAVLIAGILFAALYRSRL